jgi:magnesium transporter
VYHPRLVKAHILDDSGGVRETDKVEDVIAAHAAEKCVWVDLGERTPEMDALLTKTFRIHPLTQEDIWNDRELPKVEDFDDYLYIVGHSVRFGSSIDKLEIMELDILLGDTWVLTHNRDSTAVKAVADGLARCARPIAKGAAWVAHALLDHMVDDYLPLIDHYDEEIARLERKILDTAGTRRGPALLHRIFGLKRSLQKLRRTTIHQREVLLRLGRAEFERIPRQVAPFFRDVYDEFSRVTDLAESYRELLSNALDAYLSVQSNRMNEVMKTLTLISTVMLPLTFIAGVYGMNFDRMPELHWGLGYAFALGLMGVTAIAIVFWFRHKKWL